MPLTLRRRPRLPAMETTIPAVAPSPIREEVVRPAPLPTEAHRTVIAEPTPAASRITTSRPRRRGNDTWRDRMLGEVFFFMLGFGTWLSNAVFTVLGVTAPVGLNLVTGVIGFGFHVLLSRAELYLWHRWRDPWYLLILVGCVLIDVGTTLVGLLPIASKWLPGLVSGTPQDVFAWVQILGALLTDTDVPVWWPNAVALLLIALAFALGSERLLRKFYTGMRETWLERHA